MFRNDDKERRLFLGNATFDEANYYQGNSFQIGGTDRKKVRINEGFGKGPQSVRLMRADERIQEDAWSFLRKNLKVDIGNIEVMVQNGVISLYGSVNNLSEKREVEKSIEHVPGVIDILNELIVTRIYG